MSDHVDTLSADALAEARQILAEELHHAGRSVNDLDDAEIAAMVDNTYEGGAAQLQRDMDGNWA